MAITATASGPANQWTINRVLDDDLRTLWSTDYDPLQSEAWITLDLGASQEVGRVRWYVALPEAAQDYDLLVSSDGSVWQVTTGGSRLQATATPAWYERYLRYTARYLTFVFRNRTRTTSTRLGGLATIEVYQP